MKEIATKKMVSVPARREQVAYARCAGCRCGGLARCVRVGAIGAWLSIEEGGKGRAGDRADERAFGAVSALRLSAHSDLSWAATATG